VWSRPMWEVGDLQLKWDGARDDLPIGLSTGPPQCTTSHEPDSSREELSEMWGRASGGRTSRLEWLEEQRVQRAFTC